MPDGSAFRRPVASPAPRLLTRAQVRCYLQCTVTELEERIAVGLLPHPVWGAVSSDKAARWDVRQIDRMLDTAAGPAASIEAAEDYLDRALGLR